MDTIAAQKLEQNRLDASTSGNPPAMQLASASASAPALPDVSSNASQAVALPRPARDEDQDAPLLVSNPPS